MTDFRLKSLEIYNNMNLPVWGPNIDELNIDNIVSYVSLIVGFRMIGKRLQNI